MRLRLFILGALAPAWAQAEMLVYLGTYTKGKSAGIYVTRLDAASGALAPPELAVESVNPSFLAVHPTGRFLYSVNEVQDGQASAFSIEATARLRLLNQSSSKGAGPCYLSLDRAGRHLFVANYGGGSVTVIPVGRDGALGPATDSVKHPGSKARAHSIDLDAANRFAIAADLGLDRVFVYPFDPVRGALGGDPAFVSLEPGAGPRHVAFHPDGRFAWVLNELALTLTTLRYEAEKGALEAAQSVSSLPEGTAVAPGFSGAEVMVRPDGRFLYASNRGHDTIAVFGIDEGTGALRRIEHVSTGGKTPRGFGIDPSGQYLLAANQDSDRVVAFRIDRATGRLTATGQTVEVGAPVALAFVTAGPGALERNAR